MNPKVRHIHFFDDKAYGARTRAVALRFAIGCIRDLPKKDAIGLLKRIMRDEAREAVCGAKRAAESEAREAWRAAA